MLHLVDGFFVFLFGEFAQAPIGQHPRMQEILVDGGEFVLENDVEELDGLGIAGKRSVGLGPGASA